MTPNINNTGSHVFTSILSYITARLASLSAVAKPTPVLILAADPWLGIVAQSGSTQAQSSGSLQVIHRQHKEHLNNGTRPVRRATLTLTPDFGLARSRHPDQYLYLLPTQQPVGGL